MDREANRNAGSGRQQPPGDRGGFVRRLVAVLTDSGRYWRQRRGDDFTRAYVTGLSHRLPLLYLVVVFDALLLALRFRDDAPLWLIAVGPLLGAYGLIRAYYWLPVRVNARGVARQREDLDRMARLGGLSAVLFVGWTLSLYTHADADQRSLIQYVLAVTMFSGILGLGHAPRTALALAISFPVPATAFFLWTDDPNAAYVALVQMGVTVILLLVANGHHRDFVRLELSRQQLVRREQQAARLAHAHYRQATVDSLTGGMNRRAILARLERMLNDGGESRAWLALVDLDGFKHINDTYGHAAGDAVLRAVSVRIGEADTVAAHGRLGGDEFAILLDGRMEADLALAACQGLSAEIAEPIVHNGVRLRLHGSMGLYRATSDTVRGCLERADAALYKAKAIGEGAVCLFGADDESALQQRSALTRQFNDCVLNERLRLLYQPIHDQRSGRKVALEAFARWSPDGVNWLPPSSFLAIAEATGRTGELTRLVLARALAECPPSVTGLDLAINLAPRDVLRHGAPDIIAAIVKQAGEAPGSIVLEVTERALVTDPKRAAAQLQDYRDKGFRIALDDFGAGWSSLSHLRELPLDFIKLDRELAGALAHDPGVRAVAGMIV
ncbi:MAG: hypothetical protein RIS94_2256, partial [Pseudomonadota bacterium]